MPESVRKAMLLWACMEVLRESDVPMRSVDVLGEAARQIAPTPYEAETINDGGPVRWQNAIRWGSGVVATVGWMSKQDGRWNLTEAGEAAMDTYGPDEFLSVAERRYREIMKQRRAAQSELSGDEHRLARALSVVDAGSWTTHRDLGIHMGVRAEHIPRFLAASKTALPGSHRVLEPDGTVPPIHALHPSYRGRILHHMLETEGVEFDADGHASPGQRIVAGELAERLIELEGESAQAVRAWLVRGSSVDGRDLVPGWMREDYVSLAASQLRQVAFPVGGDELSAIVDEDYQHKTYSARRTKVEEFDAFGNRMRPGDYLLTPSGGKTYIGRIESDAGYVHSEDQRSNLRRRVRWFNPSQPVPFGNLPAPLPAKLSSQDDVVELTENVAQIEALLREMGIPIDEPVPQPERELAFPNVDDDLADDLMMDRAWLQDQADLLWDRKQMIFYGPPGTGKTYLARKLAKHLAGAGAVKLVQFHPSYTYEDFFEGFRPKQKDGQLIFELHDGPFRKLVESALEHRSDPYILIIDEINRANLAKVFGELYFLLEYREDTIGLLYSAEKEFTLPENVFIIGTMNTTDRSIALVDAAMRRRFAFVELHPAVEPTSGLLRSWLAARGLDERPADLLDELNRRIEDRDLAIGPSFLMRESIHRSPKALERVWETSILPLLAEQHYGSAPEILDRYRLDALGKALDNRTDPRP